MVELAKNIDGYRLSSYFYKDRDGKIVSGPVWDYDLSLGNADYNTGWMPDGWYYSILSDSDYPYYRRLFEDPDFAQAYVDRWTELRRDVLSEDRLIGDIDDAAAYLDEAQRRNFQRWPVLGVELWPNWYVGATYADELNFMRTWLDGRLAWIDSQSPTAPRLSQDGGTIEPGVPVTISAPDGAIYYTTDGSDPRLPGGAISPAAVALGEVLSDTEFITAGAFWQYLDIGTNLGTAWRKLDYDRTSWRLGPAQLGYGDADEATVVSYGPNAGNKYVTTYFSRAFEIDDASALDGLRLRLLCDDGAVVYLNGQEVLRTNMPTGTVSYNTFASSAIAGDAESQFQEFVIDPARLLDGASALLDGTNLIAVEVHQCSATSSDISFDLELTGTSTGASGQVSFDENTLLDGPDVPRRQVERADRGGVRRRVAAGDHRNHVQSPGADRRGDRRRVH